jgi:putative transposase
MGYRRDQFGVGEWYHCYSRGVDKRTVFESDEDYERFLQSLYVSNEAGPTNRDNFKHLPHHRILELQRETPLVAIGTYSLMPNHFHLLLKEITEGGITRFMHKVGTSYTMYFNIKNERTGNLFVKPFRSRHVSDDRYFRRVAQYIHLNAAELFEPGWKEGSVRSMHSLEKKIRAYRFSSYMDYLSLSRPEKRILDNDAFDLLQDGLPLLSDVLSESVEYHANLK